MWGALAQCVPQAASGTLLLRMFYIYVLYRNCFKLFKVLGSVALRGTALIVAAPHKSILPARVLLPVALCGSQARKPLSLLRKLAPPCTPVAAPCRATQRGRLRHGLWAAGDKCLAFRCLLTICRGKWARTLFRRVEMRKSISPPPQKKNGNCCGVRPHWLLSSGKL